MRVMRANLSADVYASLRKTIDEGSPLDLGVANAVAQVEGDVKSSAQLEIGDRSRSILPLSHRAHIGIELHRNACRLLLSEIKSHSADAHCCGNCHSCHTCKKLSDLHKIRILSKIKL